MPSRISLAQAWGLLGVLLLLGDALFRLFPMAKQMLSSELSLFQQVLLLGVVGFFALIEGHKGFGQSLAPRLAARLQILRDEPTKKRVWLAPLFLMALVDATPKRLAVNWILTFGIVFFIIVVRLLPAPYRGIVDAGVVVGLTWGTLAILYFAWRVFSGKRVHTDPELRP